MTMYTLSFTSSARDASFFAYSIPALVSWIEQGPTMSRNLGSLPERILRMISLDSAMKDAC